MKCKCGHDLTEMFTAEGVDIFGKQEYLHYCYDNHSPTDCRQYSGHSSRKCCKCNCTNPEPKEEQ